MIRGHRRGRELGFPTANLESPAHTAIPADGVYAGQLARLDSDGTDMERWPAAISIGTNPTFGEGARTVEAYALDRDDRAILEKLQTLVAEVKRLQRINASLK